MKKCLIFILIVCVILGGCKKDNNPQIFTYTVEDVQIATENFSLSGKLTLSQTDQPIPAVLMISGSGPADMDSTINALKPFKDLSEQLAQKGIASLRFHKRTYEFNQQVAKQYDFIIEDEYIEDTLKAFELLEKDDRIQSDNIYLLGHSMGAQIAPIIINLEPKIKGGILLAGSTTHLLDILLEQVKAQDEELYQTYLPGVHLTKSLIEVKSGEEHYGYFGCYGAYWVHYNKINLETELLNVANNHPLLIMQGGKDLQIFSNHFEKYKTLLADYSTATFKYYPNLNHCFVDGRGETLITAYHEAKTIPDNVIQDIYDWINELKLL